ncbi:MAG TPA: bifunctional methylenetetrahydrofolate dehydrogenase/methenyltetrahydrofolate cyclohydrolase FolD [Alphaproteobacteria bacterium]|nr:bifunctional methylenetetrahydrofolate dehydrogenase/methenyltetrahydrofolate cyclohydrolase FolD [Alphaproteobacteria bacterium]
MTEKRIDGKAVAQELRRAMAAAVTDLKAKHGLVPGLAVVLVGDHAPSEIYVRNKQKSAKEVGLNSYEYNLPASTSQKDLLKLIADLNVDKDVHGILVQLPLPNQIDPMAVLSAIDPAKDVDGFHVTNAGRLAVGLPAMIPCTPKGCLYLLKDHLKLPLAGMRALVIGRSNIVGKPMAALLLAEGCTVTVAHSKTKDLPAECAQADIIVAAVGRAEFVKGEWIKPGAVVIDVGINRVDDAAAAKGYRVVGDVDFNSAYEKASAITPVPGGVGPMTIACLLSNTIKAACVITGVPRPAV